MLSAEYRRRIIERSFSYIADACGRKLKDRGLTFDDVEYFQCWPLRDPVLRLRLAGASCCIGN